MDGLYRRLHKSLQTINKRNEQKTSIFIGILMVIITTPLLFLTIGLPIYNIWHNITKEGWNNWIKAITIDGFFLLIISFSIGMIILRYFISGILIDVKIILLLKDLEKFNLMWKNNHKKIQNIDEILDGINSIHNKINRIPILKNYVSSKDSRYIFLQKTEIEYFIEVLNDLRSDLSIRLTEQQSTLEFAKSEVSEHIHGTDELNQVSELQQARLDRQIKQFEELQRVLIKA